MNYPKWLQKPLNGHFFLLPTVQQIISTIYIVSWNSIIVMFSYKIFLKEEPQIKGQQIDEISYLK
jgi:hypothetical protein